MFKIVRKFSKTPSWATCDPFTLSSQSPYQLQNLCEGQWVSSSKHITIPDPLTNESFLRVPDPSDLSTFAHSARQVPKSGLFNPLKRPEEYLKYGELNLKIAAQLKQHEDFFAKLIQRVMPKSDLQARGEVVVTRKFFENFGGDNVRFLQRGFSVPGDYSGQ